MTICVFCSANEQMAPACFDAARELGAWSASCGHAIVFGGHDAGLMHAVSQAAREAGGRVIGVVPRRISQMGKASVWMDVEIACEDLTDRKQEMMCRSDAFVVLPGGLGTLDELFTVAAMHTLGYHRKPIVLWNIGGYWDSPVSTTCRPVGPCAARGSSTSRWPAHSPTCSACCSLPMLQHDGGEHAPRGCAQPPG